MRSLSDLNTSTAEWYNTVLTPGPISADHARLTAGNGWVDVRDLALAHVRTLERHAAGGERIIVCAGSFVWQDWRECSTFHSTEVFVLNSSS